MGGRGMLLLMLSKQPDHTSLFAYRPAYPVRSIEMLSRLHKVVSFMVVKRTQDLHEKAKHT
jgi:hypothetical protein